MIHVDSSVWIDYFNGVISPATDKLDEVLCSDFVVVSDLVLIEVLQGFRDEGDYQVAKELMTDLGLISISDTNIAMQGACNYRELRRKGVTVRKTINTLIATFCIEKSLPLLYSDRDFDPFVKHLGLATIE